MVHGEKVFPLAWVFMHGRTEQVYDSIFKIIFKDFENYKKNVMCDYEQAMRNSIIKCLQEAVLKGCYFHHVQAIQKASQELGLWKKIKNDHTARMHLRLLMAVATLPSNEMKKGYECVKSSLPQKYANDFKCIFQYYRKNWLLRRDPEEVSVWKLFQNTNNYCESYHAWLASFLRRRPKPWKLIALLLEKMSDSERKWNSIQSGVDPSRRTTKTLISKGRMNEASEKYKMNLISMSFYLKQMSCELKKRKSDFEAPSDDSSSEAEDRDHEDEDEHPMVDNTPIDEISHKIRRDIKILSNEVISKPGNLLNFVNNKEQTVRDGSFHFKSTNS
ncbi:uncharacterized protein LOC123272205 [Cotesia glomerata]|uniref:uncharacterized protein LOC123272205 n=1 Tax=Cotesia glomerata TaxID=32391 RepID=UPI001D02E3A5|nr:uncharacterized protein LOC123272205 [Cotesia glomerata]